jgi:mRNA interferase MazF
MEQINQYEIVLVNLDPTVGNEMKKTRPCVVISPNEMNKHLKTIILAPMTTTSKSYPTRVGVLHNGMQGWIVLDQIRTIDRTRIVKILGTLSEKEVKKVKRVIKEMFVD